ncbi:hypothetical protein AC579_5211 [Pseudocercospora musae]|uniref:Uncharacterized protein n=1 Tax=Pseudocercospora musae TaxID=113226 RepID=A0A139IDB4_9PEZI|nr:hypothetical protein AC579_5211 [Pseudocercospora musae]
MAHYWELVAQGHGHLSCGRLAVVQRCLEVELVRLRWCPLRRDMHALWVICKHYMLHVRNGCRVSMSLEHDYTNAAVRMHSQEHEHIVRSASTEADLRATSSNEHEPASYFGRIRTLTWEGASQAED